ncbi:MAG TPA: hypothetical protein VH540_23835 [Ktedonobacterales bacterium]|jgi:hypothetical protein
MNNTRESARQMAACRSILIRTHSRVRVYLWRRWDWWDKQRQARFLPWVLTTLWEGIRQFPNQEALAGYLQSEGRQFCQNALNESRTALRFLALAGAGLVLVAGLALTISLLNLESFYELESALWAGVIVGAPLWILFFSVELIEYRTARYLSAAIETAIERLGQVEAEQ